MLSACYCVILCECAWGGGGGEKSLWSRWCSFPMGVTGPWLQGPLHNTGQHGVAGHISDSRSVCQAE
jgi:hypothetical protein